MPRSSVWLLSLATAAVALAATGCGGATASAQRILGGDQHRVLGRVGQIDPGAEGVGIGVSGTDSSLDRSVPAKAQLQAADARLVVYTVGSDLHLFSRTGDRVIHTPAAPSRPLDYYGATLLQAALSAAGLFYAYDVKGSRFPGRVVFVPRSALPR